MSEIYWLTRLDYIVTLCGIFCVTGWILLVIASICYFVMSCEYTSNGYESSKRWANFWKKWLKTSSVFAIIGTIIVTFIPTTKEAFMIWGVGGTIDYMKSNEKVQQLPDKCIDYLDAWIEQINKEKKNHDKRRTFSSDSTK